MSRYPKAWPRAMRAAASAGRVGDPGIWQTCMHCCLPTSAAGRFCCHCAVSRERDGLWSAYDAAAGAAADPGKTGVKPRKGKAAGAGSSGRGPSAAQRAAFLERWLPASERIRRAEARVAACESDVDAAREQLRAVLAPLRFEPARPPGAGVLTISSAAAQAIESHRGRVLPADQQARLEAVKDAARRLADAETVLPLRIALTHPWPPPEPEERP